MTGEAWGHGVMKSDYYQNGFDAMINFDFQDQANQALACFSSIESTYNQMAEKLQNFNVLSYLSSHDTRLFFKDDAQQSLANSSEQALYCCWLRGQYKSSTVMKAGGSLAQPVPIRCRVPVRI